MLTPAQEQSAHPANAISAALPDAPATWLPPGTIADRLLALLPRGDISSIAARATWPVTDATPKSQRVARVIAINLLLMAGMLCAQWALADLKLPADAPTLQAPASGAALSPALPSGTGY